MDKTQKTRQTTKPEQKELSLQRSSTATPMRAYKDSIFRLLFKEKKELLELYNAMNDTSYADEKDLIITTLENALYLGMKNDVSFVLYDQLNLYEHQSTQNPNMPLRDLFYVADVYSALTQDDNLYGTCPIKIPEARFVIFYNGKDWLEERRTLKLSDLYESKSEEPDLELKVLEINLNPGNNVELMEKCRTLREYMILVDKVRQYEQVMPFSEAINRTVNECINENILRDFLRKNKNEVIKVSIYEYDEERQRQLDRRDARRMGYQEGHSDGLEKGLEKGRAEINSLILKLMADHRTEDLERSLKDPDYQEKLMKEYGIN